MSLVCVGSNSGVFGKYRYANEKMHFSSEIDHFFFSKTQLCKLRVILRSRVLRGEYILVKDTGR